MKIKTTVRGGLAATSIRYPGGVGGRGCGGGGGYPYVLQVQLA